jgi:GT2 family glycosyltransferase
MPAKQRKSTPRKKTLAQLYSEHRGKVSDKWSSYLVEYEQIFAEYRDRPVRLLEIGVQNGGSLEIWSRCFPKAVKIVGCDIDPACADLSYDDPRIAVVVGDANSNDAKEAISAHAQTFDIIIDDGSHRSSDIVRAFAQYFPQLADGGVFIAEDLHCSYWRKFEGGLYDPFSAITFFKHLADIVNHEHWGVGRPRSDILSGFCAEYDLQISELALQSVHSIQFMNSLCVVRKARPEDNRLKPRIVVGAEETIRPGLLSLDASARPLSISDETDNEWTARSVPPGEELPLRLNELAERDAQAAELEAERAALKSLIAEREGQIGSLRDAVIRRDGKIGRLEREVAERDRQIAALYSSTSWTVTKPLRAVRIGLRWMANGARAARALGRVTLSKGPGAGYRMFRDRRLLLASGSFDVDHYRNQNPDVAAARADPALHYLLYGAGEGRDPGPLFDTEWYMRQNPDVADAGVNPLVHYVRFGADEGRAPKPLRDARQNAARSPEGAKTGIEPLEDQSDAFIGDPVVAPPKPASSRKSLVAQAEAIFDAGDWPNATRRWQEVLDAFRDNDAVVGHAKLNISIARRLTQIDAYKQHIAHYVEARVRKNSQHTPYWKIAIYTAVSGGYDSGKLPEKLDSRFDYILFTDVPATDTGVWQVRPITYFHEDKARAARFVKVHPHLLLEDYDMAIWIDSNIMMLGDIYGLVERFLSSGKGVAAVPHPLRKSIYEELDACTQCQKDDPEIMRQQIAHLRAMGFEHDDLIESGFMMFNLKDGRVGSFLDLWWTEIDRFSRRDQLSLNFALSESGLDWYRLMQHPNSVRNHPVFAFVPHDADRGPGRKLIEGLELPVVDPYAGPSYAEVREQRIAAQRHRKIDVVVCVHNALKDVELCLESVRHARKGENQRLIIIDDGSDQPTARYLAEFARGEPWIELHRSDHARGYPKAANQGLAASSGELVILLNSDTIVTDGWAEKMADAVFSTPGAGIVGPMSNAASHQSIPEHRGSKGQTAINELPPGLSAEDMNRYCEQWTTSGVLPRTPLVHGFCFGVTREVISKIGFFDDDNFPRGYGEENDYCFRATDAGFGLVIATHTYVFHAKSKSYTSTERVALMKAASQAFERLHGRARIQRAVKSMEDNPFFVRLRQRASELARGACSTKPNPDREYYIPSLGMRLDQYIEDGNK